GRWKSRAGCRTETSPATRPSSPRPPKRIASSCTSRRPTRSPAGSMPGPSATWTAAYNRRATMRRSSAVRVGTIRLRASAGLAACAPKTPAAAAPPPVGVPPPPARTVSGPESPPLSNTDLVKVFASRGLDAREEDAGVVIYLPTVYLFAFGKSDVDAAARRQLAELATLLAEPMLAGRRIMVEGHADGVGSRQFNLTL